MYHLVYGIIYLFSLLPFRVLYLFSDLAYFILYYVIGYRKKVVMANLLIAFPEKTEEERKKIAKKFYKGFADNFIEMVKMFSISGRELNRRFKCDYAVLDELYDTGVKVQLHSGHFFNWEFGNLAYSHNIKYPMLNIYLPLSNKIVDRLLVTMRRRFGATLMSATEFNVKYAGYKNKQYCMGLIADQNPGHPRSAYWTEFFGRKVPVAKGPERGAKVSNTAVAMCNFYRIKRGYYGSDLVLLTTEPRTLPHGEITRKFIAFVEESIRKNPSNYLWSHRRWKWEFNEEEYGKLVV